MSRANYKAQDFIDAIPGTGGIVSALADRVGCAWNTAKKYVTEYATVAEAWDAECHKVTDKARHNIVRAIQGGDLQMSKWWLQVMDEDFVPREKRELSGAVDTTIEVVYVNEDTPDATEPPSGTADGGGPGAAV